MNDIKIGMLSLFGMFCLGLEHRLRNSGLVKWLKGRLVEWRS